MYNLLIPKEYKDAIEKMNESELENVDDVKKCLFYVQNYRKDRIDYHFYRDRQVISFSSAYHLGLCLTFLGFFFSSLFAITDGLPLLFQSFFPYTTIFCALSSVVFRSLAYRKAKNDTMEEERQLTIMANEMQVEKNNKQAVREIKDIVEENVKVDEYIKNIKSLIIKAVQVKYPTYEDDIQGLFALANEYLKCKEESGQIREIDLPNYSQLLKKFNLLELQVNHKINRALDIRINTNIMTNVQKELQDLGIKADANASKILEDDLTPTLSLADGTEMKLTRE